MAAPLQLQSESETYFDYFAIYAGKDVTDRALGVLATVIPEEYRRNSRRKPG